MKKVKWELNKYQLDNLPTDFLIQDDKENVIVTETGFRVLEPYPNYVIEREIKAFNEQNKLDESSK